MALTTNGSPTLRYMFAAITAIGASFAKHMHACVLHVRVVTSLSIAMGSLKSR